MPVGKSIVTRFQGKMTTDIQLQANEDQPPLKLLGLVQIWLTSSPTLQTRGVSILENLIPQLRRILHHPARACSERMRVQQVLASFLNFWPKVMLYAFVMHSNT